MHPHPSLSPTSLVKILFLSPSKSQDGTEYEEPVSATILSKHQKDWKGKQHSYHSHGPIFQTGSVQQKHKKTESQKLNHLPLSDPPVIKDLTVSDVGLWLEKLKLEKYIQDFRDNAIDGVMLLELSEDIFISEFNMRQFEAKKLWKFVSDGYIPKL